MEMTVSIGCREFDIDYTIEDGNLDFTMEYLRKSVDVSKLPVRVYEQIAKQIYKHNDWWNHLSLEDKRFILWE